MLSYEYVDLTNKEYQIFGCVQNKLVENILLLANVSRTCSIEYYLSCSAHTNSQYESGIYIWKLFSISLETYLTVLILKSEDANQSLI